MNTRLQSRCGRKFRFDETFIGTLVLCPTCGRMNRVRHTRQARTGDQAPQRLRAEALRRQLSAGRTGS